MNEGFNVNNSSDEDWTISKADENLPPNQRILEPIEEWGMTGKLVSPNKNSDGWKMPEPKFRNSSGSSPHQLNDNLPNQDLLNFQAELKTSPVSPENPTNLNVEPCPAMSSSLVASSDEIEPQPDISEAFTVAEIEIPSNPPKKHRSKGMRIFLAIFGVFTMIAFAIVFLLVVYFLFFYKSSVE